MAPCRGKRCREGQSVNRFRNWSQDDPKSGRMREVRVRILTILKPITRTAMSKYILGMAAALLAAAVIAVPVQASKAMAKEPGTLNVYGNSDSGLFSQGAIDRAKSAFAAMSFDRGLHLTIDTYKELPANKQAAFKELGDDKARKAKFFHEWTLERAKTEKENGPYVLICRASGARRSTCGSRNARSRIHRGERTETEGNTTRRFREGRWQTDRGAT